MPPRRDDDEQRVQAPFSTTRSAEVVGKALRNKPAGDNPTLDLVQAYVKACKKVYGGWPEHPDDHTRSTGYLATRLIVMAAQWSARHEPDDIPIGTARAALIIAVRLMHSWGIEWSGPSPVHDEWSDVYSHSYSIVRSVIAHEPVRAGNQLHADALLRIWDLSYDTLADIIESGQFDVIGDLSFPSENAACSALLRKAETYAKSGRWGKLDSSFTLRVISMLHSSWELDKAVAENLAILEPEPALEPKAPPESEVLSPQPLPPEPAILEQPGSYVDPLEEIGVFEEFADSGKPRKKGRR